MQEYITLFRSLADEARLRILNLLFESGELCVCDIESTLGFTQTKVSRHAGYLKRAGLIKDRKSGRWVLYSIADPQTDEQRLIIKNVREILLSHTLTKKDSRKLMKNVSKGCCATFVTVKPNHTPKRIELH
ncbi:MAG: metalloregulator ArsR/SmtB family transcription factor [Ignavibacteriae bacterium]|nr:metalloregulator ArsR/SmtB family transcription factor [Ignavibacteria bacterium]MBI3364001.1 metalloregulator ArsR/SmtB family transcription factor [Ignavibacteriota bacterium]